MVSETLLLEETTEEMSILSSRGEELRRDPRTELWDTLFRQERNEEPAKRMKRSQASRVGVLGAVGFEA